MRLLIDELRNMGIVSYPSKASNYSQNPNPRKRHAHLRNFKHVPVARSTSIICSECKQCRYSLFGTVVAAPSPFTLLGPDNNFMTEDSPKSTKSITADLATPSFAQDGIAIAYLAFTVGRSAKGNVFLSRLVQLQYRSRERCRWWMCM